MDLTLVNVQNVHRAQQSYYFLSLLETLGCTAAFKPSFILLLSGFLIWNSSSGFLIWNSSSGFLIGNSSFLNWEFIHENSSTRISREKIIYSPSPSHSSSTRQIQTSQTPHLCSGFSFVKQLWHVFKLPPLHPSTSSLL